MALKTLSERVGGAGPAAVRMAEEPEAGGGEAGPGTVVAADFGGDLGPDEPAGDEEEDNVAAGRGAEDFEVASPEEAAPAIGEEDDYPIKAAIAPGPDRS